MTLVMYKRLWIVSPELDEKKYIMEESIAVHGAVKCMSTESTFYGLVERVQYLHCWHTGDTAFLEQFCG